MQRIMQRAVCLVALEHLLTGLTRTDPPVIRQIRAPTNSIVPTQDRCERSFA